MYENITSVWTEPSPPVLFIYLYRASFSNVKPSHAAHWATDSPRSVTPVHRTITLSHTATCSFIYRGGLGLPDLHGAYLAHHGYSMIAALAHSSAHQLTSRSVRKGRATSAHSLIKETKYRESPSVTRGSLCWSCAVLWKKGSDWLVGIPLLSMLC